MFINYLYSKGKISKEIFDKMQLENITYLDISKFILENDYFNESIKFFDFIELKNTKDLKIDIKSMQSIDNFFNLVEKEIFCFSNNQYKNLWLMKNPQDTIKEKIMQKFHNATFSLARENQFNAIVKNKINHALIEVRARKISSNSNNSMKNNDFITDAQLLYKSLIENAIENRVSDMHIIPMSDAVNIEFRIDGKIEPYATLPRDIIGSLKNIISNEAKLSQKNPNTPDEGKIKYKYNDDIVDIRVNIIPTMETFDINLRFLSSKLQTIKEIGFSDDEQEKLKKILNRTKGLIIITGPTGSGKTTTLYSGLDYIKNKGRKIITLEDPVEITLDGITQINIRKDLNFGFDKGVAYSLRHDLDIGLIGECKILDVAKEVISLADTGHLALTTLHTTDSIGAISRFINLGIKPYAISDTLSAVIAQRLVRRICTSCNEEYELPLDHKWRELFNLGNEPITLSRGTGCSNCDYKGYKGRMAIVEFLFSNREISQAIHENKNRYFILDILKKNGFETMLENGIKKAKLHYTTFDELEGLAQDLL